MTGARFDQAFGAHEWRGATPSGPGSGLEYTKSIRSLLPVLLKALDCKILLDAPCGDLNWIDQTNIDEISYIGADIVRPLIKKLSTNYSSRDFLVLDVTREQLPSADFWLCRDLLFHLSNSDIYRILFNFIQSEIKYLGTTHHPQCQLTIDCESDPSSWRLVNLTAEPFYLPQPNHVIWDSVEGYPPRWLAVWNRQQIVNWLYHINGVAAAAASFVVEAPGTHSACLLPTNIEQREETMHHSFEVSPAHRLDGGKVPGISSESHGVFRYELCGAKFSMLSLADCQVTMSYLNEGAEKFEPFSLRVWAAIAEISKLVLDVGAYTGIYSLLTYAKNPNAIVVAFEASQTTFGRLITNIIINHAGGRIAPVHKAVSNRSGHLDLALSGGIYVMASGESVEDAAQTSAWSRQRVETITIDEIIVDWHHFHPSDLTIPLPDCGVSLIKIDVEGHEKAALSGMRRIIERDHPTMLIEILQPDDLKKILMTLEGYEGVWVGEKGSLSREHLGDGWNALLFHEKRRDAVRKQVEEATGVRFPD